MSTYPKDLIDRFFACFTKVFYSFEMHQRKPDGVIYQTVLQQINAHANETLFVDDKLENVQSAKQLGIYTWHLQVGKEDVVDLFQKFPQL
jgi:putative hydrolase of the HAD superfamily